MTLPVRRARTPRRDAVPDADKDRLKELWATGKHTQRSAAIAMGKTPGQIAGMAMRLHLHFPAKPRRVRPDDPMLTEGRTRFGNRVEQPGELGVLKPGWYQRKLGRLVLKGPWKGMPIYSLTLEERATCPRTCAQWVNCYGNNMGMSVRYQHGPALTRAIHKDLVELQRKHTAGFVVRLHILGDFYSTGYVEFWARALDKFPALRVFGYSARQLSDPIGHLIAKLRDERWDRFAIRTSGGKSGPRTLVGKPRPTAITCPAQTGGTSHCGACALCWAPAAKNRAILFEAH